MTGDATPGEGAAGDAGAAPGEAGPPGPDRRTRAAGAVAGLLSLAAAGLLAAVWYDDGTAAERGPLVLGPIAGAPDQVPGLGWVRSAVVLVVAATVAAAAAVLAARPPRTRRPAAPGRGPGPFVRDRVPPAPVRRPDREPGPFISDHVPPPPGGARRAAAWAAVGAAAAAAVTGVAAWRLGGHATPVVPAVTVVLAGAAAGWALVAARSRAALPGALAVLVAVAVAAPLLGPWWAYGRLVERSTTDAAPPAADGTGPDRPGALSSRDAEGAAAYGPYLVVRREDPDGRYRIVVLNGADGTERWSYRHRDAYVGIAGDPDSATLVLSVDRDGAAELRAFDLAGGRPLWDRREAAGVVGAARFDNSSVRLPGVLLLLDRKATRLRAYEPRTGALRWERTLPDPYCGASADYARVGDLLVATYVCSNNPVVPAFRLDTGADAWTTRVAPGSTPTGGDDREPLVADGVVGVWTVQDDERDVLTGLDGGTGRVLWRRTVDVQIRPAVVVTDRFVVVEAGPGGRRQAVALDPRTGRPAWTTRLPAVPRAPSSAPNQQVAGTDGQRFYLLTGIVPGGPDSTRLTVLGADGRVLGTAAFPGCAVGSCAPGQLLPPDDAQLVATGGTLLVIPPRLGPDRRVTAVRDGSAFTPAA